MSPIFDPLIRERDCAAMLAVSVSTFRRRVSDGTVAPPIRIGGASRWRRSEIEAVIARAEAQREAA